MEYWIVYDLASGAELYAGSGNAGSSIWQHLPDGAGIIVVPQAVVSQQPRDLDALRRALLAGIDVSAEEARQAHVTPGSGQALTYGRKEAEARQLLDGMSGPTPFLSAEAAVRGISISDLASEVIAAADAWATAGAEIEASRIAAKLRLAQATTLGGLIEAARVTWPDALSNTKKDD